MMIITKIGMIEWVGKPPSQEKKIVIIIKCKCGSSAFLDIPCPADLAGCPCGTLVGINEFGRLEAIPEAPA